MHLKPVEGGYNIIAGGFRGQCGRKYLSVSASCSSSNADWWNRDDGSGRQVWKIEEQSSGKFHLINTGRKCDTKYLSTKKDSDRVTLAKSDDGSGRQRFTLHEFKKYEEHELPETASIYSLGMDDGRNELSLSKTCNCD